MPLEVSVLQQPVLPSNVSYTAACASGRVSLTLACAASGRVCLAAVYAALDVLVLQPGLWIRNDLFRIRLRIRLLRMFRLRIRDLFRIRQRWSPPRESCAENSHFIREITTTFISVGDYTNVFVTLAF
jgi:hypothetical protein